MLTFGNSQKHKSEENLRKAMIIRSPAITKKDIERNRDEEEREKQKKIFGKSKNGMKIEKDGVFERD